MNERPFSKTYRYLCSYCHYLVETEGPWPYRRGVKQRHSYENLREVCSGPVQGLMARVYCPGCDKNKEYAIVEYKSPLANLSEVWWTTPLRTKVVCHKCRGKVHLILSPGEVRCPRCKKGTLDLYEPMAREESECFPVAPPASPLRVRQAGKPVRVPKPILVIDSQEHRGYKFERFTNWFAGTIHKRLPIGDYTILGMEDEVVVERKTLPDLVRSIIQERKNFIKKCEGLSVFKRKCVVIEGSLASIKTPYEDSQAHPNAVLGSLLAAQERWDIPVYFLDNFLLAEEFVASLLSKYHAYRWLEINGFQRCLIEGDI